MRCFRIAEGVPGCYAFPRDKVSQETIRQGVE